MQKKFAEYLSEGWPNDNQVKEAFKQSESKDPDFLSFVFHRMKNWKQEEVELYGDYAPLDLKDQVIFLNEILENLKKVREDESKLRDISKTFNDIWAPPHFFL